MPSVSAKRVVSAYSSDDSLVHGSRPFRLSLKKRHGKVLAEVLLALFVLSAVSGLYGASASVSDVGWLDGFPYRKAITVSAISGAGTGYQVPLTISTNPISFATKVMAGASDAKIALVNGQRYILTSTWASTSPITIWAADEGWNRGSVLASSNSISECANDFYTYTFDSIPDTIIMVGTNSSTSNLRGAFIAGYNISSTTWTWENISGVGWITNIIDTGSNFYIVPAGNVNFLWSCPTDSLFNPQAWVAIDVPSFARDYVENRFAYFNGEMFMLRSNHALYWELYKWDLGSSWTLLTRNPDTSRDDDATPLVFPYVTATEYGVAYTVPFANQTWSIYYSSDGSTFNQLANVPMIDGFAEASPKEIHCWAYPYSYNRIGVLNTKLSNTNSYVAIYDTDGNELRRGTGYASHYTEASFIEDGSYLVAGGEFADGSTPADLKIINLNDPTALSTNGDSQEDFSDLRFTGGDGATELAFWVQDYVPNISVNVWVKVNDDLDNQRTIYMYYGSSSVASASNIEGTFIFGDDFRTQKSINMAKWQLYGSPTFSFSTASGLSMSKQSSYAQIVSTSSFDFSETLRVVQMQRLNAFNSSSANLYVTPSSTGADLASNENFVAFSTAPLYYALKDRVDNGSVSTVVQNSYLSNDWLRTEMATDGAFYLGMATSCSQDYLNTDIGLNMTKNYLALQVSAENGTVVTADWQYIFITKYAIGETIITNASPAEKEIFYITATADSHSHITPSGTVPARFGNEQTFSLSVDSHYHLARFFVDGTAVPLPESLTYTFDDVQDDHTISVSSIIETYNISVVQPAHGSIWPNATKTVNYGDTPSYSITADSGYHVVNIKVDGGPVGASTSYTFNPIEADHTITAEIAQNTYYIHSSASSGGTISPTNGSQGVAVQQGQNQTFTITANSNYNLSDVYVDNATVDMHGETTYTFRDVQRSHDIYAVFKPTAPTQTTLPTPTTPPTNSTPIDANTIIISVAIALTSLTLLALKYPKKR